MKRPSAALLVFFVAAVFMAFFNLYCSTPQPKEEVKRSVWLNLHDSVKYVGIQTCRGCHADIYNTYIHTGMGSSIDLASREKSAASFSSHDLVYDKHSDFYYKPYWKGDKMMIMEFRLKGADTVHKREEEVKYIVGSGQHTNSHMMEVNGYIYQLPLTWYAQQGKWDLPPGYENGNNTRFSRIIGVECMSCHNALPEFEDGSQNKYKRVPAGIDCERCHGPGELHLLERGAGRGADIRSDTDFTIVNPAKLSWELQVDVCQRCHLQGNAVLKQGKTFFDFKPGMKLNSVLDVFMPKYKGGEKEFIMASHAERLQMSECFLANKPGKHSGGGDRQLTCITCHNPHVSVEVTGKETFNNACRSCHDGGNDCTADINLRKAVNDNCSQCHMPKSGTIDIPHVTVTDHFIRKPAKDTDKKVLKEFLGLSAINNKNPDALTRTEAYLSYFEKFNQDRMFLDSAGSYFLGAGPLMPEQMIIPRIRYYYLKGNYDSLIAAVPGGYLEVATDDWTCYRIGQALQYKGQFRDALEMYNHDAEEWYKKAYLLSPSNLDFKIKYGEIRLENGQTDEAIKLFREVVESNPKYTPALTDLGFALLKKGDVVNANQWYDKALKLDPDYEPALMNKAGLYLSLHDKDKAREMLYRVIKRNPMNRKAKNLLESLND
jgi:hypothetical protein